MGALSGQGRLRVPLFMLTRAVLMTSSHSEGTSSPCTLKSRTVTRRAACLVGKASATATTLTSRWAEMSAEVSRTYSRKQCATNENLSARAH